MKLTQLIGLCGTAIACLAHCPDATAQESRPVVAGRARVPVTITVADDLPNSSGPFEILRRPDSTPRDVILLRSGASAADLSDAVRTLLLARMQSGDLPERSAAMRMRRNTSRAPQRPFPWAQRVLNDLRRATPRDIEGVGKVESVEIWLPAQR